MTSILESQTDTAEQKCLNSWKKGPTRLRWFKLPLQVGDSAPDFELLDSYGNLVNLKGFWSNKPVLLLFWRHYGCGCGIDRASRLQQEYNNYISAGANIVIIGQGEPERATAYATKYNLPHIPILSDPEMQVYSAYGLLEGKPSQIVFDAPDDFLRRDYEAFEGLAKTRREAGRPLVDSPWQLPGEFVIDQSGIVRLTYRYQYCEDWPNPLVLIAAIKEAIWEIQ